MKTDATVTVIVPAYNAEGCIVAALESVADQKQDDLEIIVVDDASEDGTAQVVEQIFSTPSFGSRVSGFKLLQQSANAGPAGARNMGVAEAGGEWIAFLDGDDEWLPGKMALQLRLADDNPAIDLWCGDVATLSPQAGPPSRSSRPSCEISKSPEFQAIGLKDFITANPIATSTVMVRKAVFGEVGGFDERFSGAEDYDLWMRIAGRSEGCIGKVNAPIAKYRSESGSLSMDDRKFLPDALAVLDKAFGAGGALRKFAERKNLALGNQYWNASWMAFNRGSRRDAVRLWRQGYRLAGKGLRRPWWRLLGRYLIGSAANEKND